VARALSQGTLLLRGGLIAPVLLITVTIFSSFIH
jgi:hypothetical protein